MSNFGPVHKLIVRNVGQKAERYFDVEEFEDYEIEHPTECKPNVPDDDWPLGPSHDCAVANYQNEIGCRWSLGYSGCLINEPGEYMIQAWAETLRGYDWTEYDGGLGFAEPEGVTQE